ncbi:MAG TPA: hypothetical protein VIU11_22535 [Nakamurella sp.]
MKKVAQRGQRRRIAWGAGRGCADRLGDAIGQGQRPEEGWPCDRLRRPQLSVLPCHRRLRAWERDGVISGYHARLNAPALGLTFEPLVFVTMRGADPDTVDAFEQAVPTILNVVQAQRTPGIPTTCCASSPAICPTSSRSTTTG